MVIKIEKIIENILLKSLGVKKEEKGLIFCDNFDGDGKLKERIQILNYFSLFSERNGFNLDKLFINSSGGNGIEPEKAIWERTFGRAFVEKVEEKFGWDCLEKKELKLEDLFEIANSVKLTFIPDFVLALSFFSTSHTLFRKLLNGLGTRYISMPLFDFEMFEGPLNIDFDELERETIKLKETLVGKKGCVIKNNLGTELYIDLSRRNFLADSGNFRDRGSFGNLPAGEVFIAPVEGKAEGQLVIEWSNWGKLSPPILIEIKNGKAIRVNGDERLKTFLEDTFNRDDRNRVLCELGLGTNKGAKRADNILEAEKIYGTVHVAFGDNSTFGGINRATTHIDYVIFSPEVRWFDD